VTDPRLKSHEELKATRDARRQVKIRAKLKAVNKERAAKKAESEGYDPDYLDWIRTQPCIISGRRSGDSPRHVSGDFWLHPAVIEAAHMKAGRTEGTDMTALPVASELHKEQHRLGIKSWAKKYNLDLPALIAAHRKRFSLEMAERAKK
jgi:hypothetical protein